MALLLSQEYETESGIVVGSTYWRWVGLGVDVPGGQLSGLLYAYASPLAFVAGKQPIGQRQYSVTGADFLALVMGEPVGPTLSDVLSSAVYRYVRDHDPFFAGAKDVE